jgi:16S rRNA (guanine966-N2)-methyltransferase
MRIIAGQYKGKNIFAGNDLAIRPITTKIKESVFNTLGMLIVDKDVLDLFSGSGSFGLEALSRGAHSVTFVDQAGSSIQILSKNLQSFKIPPDQFEIHNLNVQSYIQTHSRPYELILMDPPFNFSSLQELVNDICSTQILAETGILVLHHEVSNPIDHNSSIYELFKQKKFGRNLVSYILRKDRDVE